MRRSRVSAVLFAKNLATMSQFYRETLRLKVTRHEADHTILSSSGFDRIVHQIPRHIADSITLDRPPRRRELAAIKLGFPVRDIARTRAIAESLGGELDPPSAEWSDGRTITCMGHDPEGNVFQVTVNC
jgi:predicted enzyme related to lactoylglutathione lyase